MGTDRNLARVVRAGDAWLATLGPDDGTGLSVRANDPAHALFALGARALTEGYPFAGEDGRLVRGGQAIEERFPLKLKLKLTWLERIKRTFLAWVTRRRKRPPAIDRST